MNIDTIAKAYAIQCHRETNHTYDGQPYEVHLNMVVEAAEQFLHLIPESEQGYVIAGCWVHDCIEDCRQTYNDVKKATDEKVAELAFALTNEKGRNRAERANHKYYQGIRETPHAVFIKCCDRIANVNYSRQQNSRMFDLYRKEYDEFEAKLFQDAYAPLFEHLRDLLQVDEKV